MNIEAAGIRELAEAFQELPRRAQSKVVRRAIRIASTPVLKQARLNAPTKGSTEDATGTLRKSLGRRIRTNKYTGTTTAFVGPRRGFSVTTTTKGGRKVVRNAVRYAHLYEFGTARAKPHGFMRRAHEATKGTSENTLRTEIAAGVEREAAALRKK